MCFYFWRYKLRPMYFLWIELRYNLNIGSSTASDCVTIWSCLTVVAVLRPGVQRALLLREKGADTSWHNLLTPHTRSLVITLYDLLSETVTASSTLYRTVLSLLCSTQSWSTLRGMDPLPTFHSRTIRSSSSLCTRFRLIICWWSKCTHGLSNVSLRVEKYISCKQYFDLRIYECKIM